MALIEQMLQVELLMRRPEALAAARALAGDDGRVLATIDAERLAAVHESFAGLVAARWWRARFPALLATLERFVARDAAGAAPEAGAAAAASLLVSSGAFERAEGEDERASALVNAVLDALEEGRLEAPPWVVELLRYEYLLSTGLPRRARGEPVSQETEERLLGAGSGPACLWLAGGRLAREVLVCTFDWPVAALADEPYDAAPEPHVRAFFLEGGEAVEVATGPGADDALELLAQGASDEVLAAALGDEVGELLSLLREAGLLVP